MGTVEPIADRELRFARAIEGPHSMKHITREKLIKLRCIKWQMLTEQERGMRLAEARAVIAEMAL